VKSVIAFRDGRRVNLAAAVDAELYAELEATHSPRKDPVLFCGGCRGGLYIQHGRRSRDELFGYHHVADGCAETFTIAKSAMSDEHKRMAEYHVAAARAEGLEADMEVATSGRTRVDVVIDGRIGIEVQRSPLTARAAVDRTARSVAAGLESVAWCGWARPAWTGKVPGYQWLDVDLVLREMPRPRSVRSRGVATFRAERDHRGRWVPVLEPKTVLVDEAVAWMADGKIRPVVHGKYVHLVRAEGIALYEEMTGRGLIPFGAGRPVTRALLRAPEVVCARPRPVATLSPAPSPVRRGICSTPNCGQPARFYAAGWRCDNHKPGTIVALYLNRCFLAFAPAVAKRCR
jgi:hypothetical protein